MCAQISSLRAAYFICVTPGFVRKMNTPVIPVPCAWCLTISYIRLRILFRSTARAATFLGTTTEAWSSREGEYTIWHEGEWWRVPIEKNRLNSTLLNRSFLGSILPIVAYTLNFARPFRRRNLRTLAPFAVAERTRKPWVVARFRFFG